MAFAAHDDVTGSLFHNLLLSPRPADRSAFECALSNFQHLLHAIPAEDIHCFSCPDALPTAWANQFPCAGLLRCPLSVPGSAVSGFTLAAGWRCPSLSPVDVDLTPSLPDDLVYQRLSRLRYRPSVCGMMLNAQPPPLCFFLETLVVVCPAPAAILYVMSNIVQVDHLVHHGSYHILDGPQGSARAANRPYASTSWQR